MVGAMRLGLTVFGFIAAACGGLVATSASSGAAIARQPQVTIADAQQVYATTWQKFEKAFVQGDLGPMQSLATPHVLDIVESSTGCGCRWDTPHSKVLFSIPSQQGYPESFLAQISTPVPRRSIYSPYVTMVVFSKATVKQPWQVAYFGRYAGTAKYVTKSVVAPAPPALFDIDNVPTQLADFFTQEVTTGTAPAGDNWPVEGMIGEELQNYLDTKANINSGGDQQQTVFQAIDHSVAFAYPKGDIMCGSYQSFSTVTPSPGQPPISQPEDQSQWGDQLAPGIYSSLSKRGMHDVCFSVDTVDNAESDETAPISFSGGVYEMSGASTSLATAPPVSA